MAPAITVTSNSDSLKDSLTSDPSSPTLEANGPHPPAAAPFLKLRTGGSDPHTPPTDLKHSEDPILPEDDLLQQVLKTMEEGKEGAGGPSADVNVFQLFNSELELLEPLAKPPPETSPEESEQQHYQGLIDGQMADVMARQHALQRRYDRLLRIIRKKQARNVGFHTGLQIYEMVTTTKAFVKARSAALRLHTSTDDLLDADHVNGMSPKALASLVKQFVSPAMNPSLADTLSSEQAAVISSGSGQLGHRLQHVEAEFDSDMTASSSGGDSCDENTGFNIQNTSHAPIYKRAAWRFARERASAASRWSWLMANIAELEYRIRQLMDYQRQLRSNKGNINLGLPPPHPKKEGDVQMMNGYHGTEDESLSACRVKPLDLKSFRKRKLFVPGMLTPKTGKRLCQSQNQPPCCRDSCSMPCVLCFPKKVAPSANQAYQSVLPPDVGGRESLRERAARLDPAVHPVLSGSQDVSRSLHMAALLRQPGWQQSQLRQKGLARLGLGMKKNQAHKLEASATPAQPKRKYKKNNSAANALSAKLRKKAKARKKLKRINERQGADGALKKSLRLKKSHGGEGGAHGDDDGRSPSLLADSMRQVRRKRESSYDIDNIVIPYSMAALTRVEKLEYKEILTPKWRLSEMVAVSKKITVNNKASQSRSSSVDESEVEDISDEAMVLRHEPLEMDERRKFRCTPRNSIRGGVRARRTDSRAESSGANTPDPMSPTQAGTEVGTGDSPLTSPRATPLPLSIFHDDLSRTSNSSKGRRRTTSLQRDLILPEPCFEPEAAPFEPRVFPLTDEQCQQFFSAEHSEPPAEDIPAPAPQKITVVPEKFESQGGAAPSSPCSSDSTESALPEDDPEWTLDEPEVSEEEEAGAAASGGRADPPYRPPRRSH